MESAPDTNKLADAFEGLLASGSGTEDMWKTAARYAKQFSKGQIYALTRIKFYARMANKDTKDLLMGFYDDYVEQHNHYNTARFIVMLAESDSLKRFVQQGNIQGQVKIDK